jgi:hypothetical protein
MVLSRDVKVGLISKLELLFINLYVVLVFNHTFKYLMSLNIEKHDYRLRVSSHRLDTEGGRWNRTVRGNRLWISCNKLEDVFHLLFE